MFVSSEIEPDVCLGIGITFDAIYGRGDCHLMAAKKQRICRSTVAAIRAKLLICWSLSIFMSAVIGLPTCLAADDMETVFENAMTLREANKFEAALKIYDKVLAKDPENARAHQERGAVLASLNRYEAAIAEENQALKLNPESHLAHIYKGMIYFNKNQFTEAHKEFSEAARIKPDNSVAHVRLGSVCERLNRLDEAIVEFKKAIELKPDNVVSYVGLCDVYLRQGDIDKAVEEAEQAVKIEKTAKSCNKLGAVYSMINRLDEAKQLLDKAIELNPSMVAAYENLGRVLTLQGNYAEAKSTYEKAKKVALTPKMFSALTSLNDSSICRIKVVESVADWSHENGVYVPQVTIKVKNVSGKDLSDKPIRFRARFENCRTRSELTARTSQKTAFKPDETIEVKLIAAKGFSPTEVADKIRCHCLVNAWVASRSDFESQLLLETLLTKIPPQQ